MAKVTTLKEKVRRIMRRYKRINSRRYLYNRASDLKAQFNQIELWALIHDSEKGYSIFHYYQRRKTPFTIAEWTRLISRPYGGYKTSLYTILTQSILPAINNKSGSQWVFKSLLCWTGEKPIDLRQGKNTDKRRGNPPVKKRIRNAYNRNRSRHRNNKR